jgi:N-acetylmuramoyl-L-alanine amidase
VVSIHQNSYHEEAIQGAQVFYYGTSKESQNLAELIQEELVRFVDPENHRQAKANDTYYLLKKTQSPVVIVECGFLSNWEENGKLKDEGYQDQLVWAIHMGVMRYLNQ